MSLLNLNVGRILGKETPTILSDVGDWQFTSNVGIEVEVERFNWNAPQNLSHWQFTSDSSLRDNGAELISRILSGRNVYRAVHDLSEYFSEQQGDAAFNERTSLHVHIDITDLTVNQLKNMVYLCIGLEPLLMQCVHSSRRNNNFCLEVKAANEVTNRLGRMFRATSESGFVERMSRISPSGFKYAATNFANMARLGTIEFRMHHGTADKATILRWVGLLCKIKRVAVSYESVSEIRNAKVNQDLATHFCDIMSDVPSFEMDYPEVIDLLEESFEYANDIEVENLGNSTRMLEAFRILVPQQESIPIHDEFQEVQTTELSLSQRLQRLRNNYNQIT